MVEIVATCGRGGSFLATTLGGSGWQCWWQQVDVVLVMVVCGD